jgi:DNA-binding transcriptional LysR family regulator
MMNDGLGAVDLPIEALRSFMAVLEAGTIRDAAVALGIGPAVVKGHIDKLDKLLHRKLFVPTPSGLGPSEFGKQISSYAGRLLAMNDQAFSSIGLGVSPKRIRVGLPRWVMREQLVEVTRQCGTIVGKEMVEFRCDHLEDLIRDLSGGQLDVALLCNVFHPPGRMVREWWEDMHWVKSPDLQLRPGRPIPIISWPGSMSDRLAIKALNDAGMAHTVSFSASDLSSRLAAVAAGLGVLVVPARNTGPDVRIAEDEVLPSLPQTKKGIYIRNDLDARAVDPVVRTIEACIRPVAASVVTALVPPSRVIALHQTRLR